MCIVTTLKHINVSVHPHFPSQRFIHSAGNHSVLDLGPLECRLGGSGQIFVGKVLDIQILQCQGEVLWGIVSLEESFSEPPEGGAGEASD